MVESIAERVSAAFEVEHSTSIHSGIVRMLDLATTQAEGLRGLYVVAPDEREDEVAQAARAPGLPRRSELEMRYLPYGELRRNREAMARFGSGLRAVEAISRRL